MPAERPAGARARSRIALGMGPLGWILLTLLSAHPVLADSSEHVDSMLIAALPAAIHLSVADRPLVARAPKHTDAGSRSTSSSASGEAARADSDLTPTMVELSEVPWRAPTTDEVLAAAVARGSNPALEPKKPFRKRSADLFRTERPVEIGDAQMVLRLRLRAKSREAMSVELHF